MRSRKESWSIQFRLKLNGWRRACRAGLCGAPLADAGTTIVSDAPQRMIPKELTPDVIRSGGAVFRKDHAPIQRSSQALASGHQRRQVQGAAALRLLETPVGNPLAHEPHRTG